MSEMLSKKAQGIIREFALSDYYVYLRPATSRFAQPQHEIDVWWVVTVQIRSMPPHEFREEGWDLDAVIRNLGKRVPRRKELGKKKWKNYKPTVRDRGELGDIGFMAPHMEWVLKYVQSAASKSDLHARALALVQEAATEARSKQGRIGPIYDRYGPGRPSTASERGWGTMDTTPAANGEAVPDRRTLAALVPPPLPR